MITVSTSPGSLLSPVPSAEITEYTLEARLAGQIGGAKVRIDVNSLNIAAWTSRERADVMVRLFIIDRQLPLDIARAFLDYDDKAAPQSETTSSPPPAIAEPEPVDLPFGPAIAEPSPTEDSSGDLRGRRLTIDEARKLAGLSVLQRRQRPSRMRKN